MPAPVFVESFVRCRVGQNCTHCFMFGSGPAEAGGGQIAAIVSAVGVAIMGAASSYFAYQKKKLCFKIQGGQYVFL